MVALVLVAAGFALGSIPFGAIIAKRMGVDIQAKGSGNIGATNVTRVLGIVPGAITLVLDALKGALPVALALHYSGEPWTIVTAGFAAIFGHCFSPLLGGRGGKGVATALGVFLVLEPRLVGIAVIVFVITLRLTRVPAIGSLVAVLAIAAMVISRGDLPTTVLACSTFALLLYTHRTNLAKLTRSRQ
jgi:glycerol-3-phosphate acyltransferase PlsY